MNNYCAFSKNRKCIKWEDYQSTRFELEEADELCHGNWIEIQYLLNRVELLESVLEQAGVVIPPSNGCV